jgi:chemotaxis protein CheY-P-specific phosphatase CheC
MPEQQTATLATIFSEVLANLAFMFSDDHQGEPDPQAQWLRTTIGYEGPNHTGTLCFTCPDGFAALLAANLLGVDPLDAKAENTACDAVKEFMNIVCGQFVTAQFGTEDVFNLTIPNVTVLDEPPSFDESGSGDISVLSVEGHLVQFEYLP